jgi:hypothetical protein
MPLLQSNVEWGFIPVILPPCVRTGGEQNTDNLEVSLMGRTPQGCPTMVIGVRIRIIPTFQQGGNYLGMSSVGGKHEWGLSSLRFCRWIGSV